jgi:hypothetical protein
MSNDYEETYFDEPAPPPRRPDSPKRGGGLNVTLPWLIGGIVVIAAIVALVYFFAIRNTSSNKTSTGPTHSQTLGTYKVSYPKGWAPVNPDSVAKGLHAFAAFRQSAGQGVVVMRLEGKVKTINRSYVNGLRDQLRKTLPDFRFQSSHVITLKNGPALDFTYQRTTVNQVRNVVVLPVGNVSVVMATIAPTGDTKTINEVNEIVSSFQLSS